MRFPSDMKRVLETAEGTNQSRIAAMIVDKPGRGEPCTMLAAHDPGDGCRRN
jgi:hypothetical protein